MSLISEAKRLHDLGFAILWLKPKSKAPVKSKWTTGPREDWAQLKASYKPGMNMGVRLGTPSSLKVGFLTVVDVDIKSTANTQRLEAIEAVKAIFPWAFDEKAPMVLSGRGNGSCHLYGVSEKPATPTKLKTSDKLVRVYMPSAGINAKQRELLSDEDLNEGYRMRPAWEISVMGEGQQVCLPPSTHPDSGKEYLWASGFTGTSDLPKIEVQGKENSSKRETINDWTPVEFDLVCSNLPDDIVELLLKGETEDRSAALFKVTIAMLKSGWSDAEIMSCLTDRTLALGVVSYEHAKTESRKRAADWIFNYTIKKARKAASDDEAFSAEVEVSVLGVDEAAGQSKELTEKLDWRDQLERNGDKGPNAGRPKNTLKNVILILQNEISADIFRHDQFFGIDIYGQSTPWGGVKGEEIKDIDAVRIKVWIANRFRFEPDDNRIFQAIKKIADENKFHPVRDYLNGLPSWDGVERVGLWLKTYLSASGPDDYLRAIGTKTLVAMVARAFIPGVKFDQVLILEGNQGIGKSTALKKLAGPEWFSDSHINISDKDGVLNIRGAWLVELGELGGMRRADTDLLKEFISRTSDRVRVPYGRLPENFPRQGVFIGTTNSVEYLRDITGNRRFWPVEVGECDFLAVERDRDQLFAEATMLYELGEPLYLEDRETRKLAIDEQDMRVQVDTLVDKLEEFFSEEREGFDTGAFKLSDLFKFGPLADLREDRTNQLRAASALRYLGCRKVRAAGGNRNKVWRFDLKRPRDPGTRENNLGPRKNLE